MIYPLYHMKPLFLALLFSCSLSICFGQQRNTQNSQSDSGTGKLSPDFFHIPYANEKHNILNIYLAKGYKVGAPTPLYIWAHGGGGNLDRVSPDLVNRLSQSGISIISWGSVEKAGSPEIYGLKSRNDFEKVMQFVTNNPKKYNFDINKIVVGGTSRGSFITWEFSQKNPELVKGIYSTGALGDPALWRKDLTFMTSRDPRDDINPNSPPVLLVYETHLGDVNIHHPRSGLLIKDRYDELGIGHRARVEYGLDDKNLSRWSFIVDFIMEVTDDGFRKEIELNTVIIGNQVWMAKNLNVGYFRNGDIIPYAKTAKDWEDAGARGEPAWCYYNNDPTMEATYGKLYNLPAVNDPRGLAPEGWKIPTEEQWIGLVNLLGGELNAVKELKSTTGWKKNGNGNNNAGFNALPGGNRNADGSYWLEGEYGYWWIASEGIEKEPSAVSKGRIVVMNNHKIYSNGGYGFSGLSVRCIKNIKTQ